jgi:DNA-binding SARP family transcriptional activator/tetratricopeptide (TPR) repeat protein
MLRDLGARLSAPRVAVLGPPAIGGRDALRPITGRPGRLLVALAAAKRPCSIDALSEAVWGDDLPSTYRAALHVHLGALRRALGEQDGACRIERVSDGYQLLLGDCELDADLAVDLITEATRLLPDDPTASLDLAEHALGLWRGVPYTVEGDQVEPSSSHQLEALRRDAEEVLVEAMLRAGQAARAESMAAALVEAEPLREHRWGQLLRARYLAGRTADALATYREARSVLIETLGIEPGSDLRALEAAALMQDTAGLRLPAGPQAQPPGPPSTAGPFVGRDVELRRVSTALVDNRRVSILGPPGVGKTRLAIEAACAVAAGAVAWVDLGDADAAAIQVVMDWARRTPDGVVVLDSAERASEPVEEVIRRLTEHTPTIRVVVTSQAPLVDDRAVEILGPLVVPDPTADDAEIEASPAAELLRAALLDLAPSVTLSATEVAQLAGRAGGLPLALRLSAAAVRAVPVPGLLGQPSSMPGDEIDRATRTVVELLGVDARRAFADLSVLSGGFDAELGAGAAGLSVERFLHVILELVDHGLVQAHTDQLLPYVIVEPIRAVAGRMLDDAGARDETLGRVADVCIERARGLWSLMGGTSGVPLAERVAADLPRYREALDHLARSGDADRALELACRLDGPLYTLGWWPEQEEILDTALSIDGDASAMRARAHAYRARPGPMHQIDIAHAKLAGTIAQDVGHQRLAAYSDHIRSIGLWWLGRTAESVELGQSAVEDLDDSDESFEWREARKHLGVALVLDGKPEAGLAIQREVLAIVRDRSDNEFNVAHSLAYLGHCHRYLGDDSAAWANWTEARDTCRRVGNRGTAIHVDIGLAEVAIDRGDHVRALERVGEALELIRASQAAFYEPWAWTIAMRAHHLAGERANALLCARRAAAQLPTAPPGEAVRLAAELAVVALAAGEVATGARLVGVAAATPDLRELPFPSPAEADRRAATKDVVVEELGVEAKKHIDAGRRCTVAEAAGELLAE